MNAARLGRPLTPLIATLMIASVASCGGQQTAAPVRSPVSATSIPPLAPLAAWQQKGATEVPPQSVQQVSLGSVRVVNQSRGAVSDGDARAWAEALLRARNYELWSVQRGQEGFLLRSGISTAPTAVFGPDLSDLAQARQSGSSVEYTPHVIRQLLLRPVPDTMRDTFAQARFTFTPVAWYLDAVGPAYTYWIDQQGKRTVKAELKPGEPAFELVGGSPAHDPVLGEVWVIGSDFDCTAPTVRVRLAPLCNP